MALFWNKRIESDRTIYTRIKGKKRIFYLLMISGFVLFIGVPTFIKNSAFFAGLSQSNAWGVFLLVLVLMGLGVVLIIFTAIGASTVNFRLAAAKRKGKKYQITSDNNGDTVTIDE